MTAQEKQRRREPAYRRGVVVDLGDWLRAACVYAPARARIAQSASACRVPQDETCSLRCSCSSSQANDDSTLAELRARTRCQISPSHPLAMFFLLDPRRTHRLLGTHESTVRFLGSDPDWHICSCFVMLVWCYGMLSRLSAFALIGGTLRPDRSEPRIASPS